MGESLVIAEIEDGVAVSSEVHLPAEFIERPAANGVGTARVSMGRSVPLEWVSVCGVRGYVYVHAGVLQRIPVCESCMRASKLKPVPKRRQPPASPRVWTSGRILSAIQEWAALHGSPPKQHEWTRSITGFPPQSQVTVMFGTWNAAIQAAGFTPRHRGRPLKEAA